MEKRAVLRLIICAVLAIIPACIAHSQPGQQPAGPARGYRGRRATARGGRPDADGGQGAERGPGDPAADH